MKDKYLFLIYSCKKNLKKSNLIYEIISQNLYEYFIPLIIYGDPNLDQERFDYDPNISCETFKGMNGETLYEIRSERYLVLNCCDYYEGLSDKTLKMVLYYFLLKEKYENCLRGENGKEIEIKGFIKCDDDILPNIYHLKLFYRYLQEHSDVNYCGRTCNIENAHDSQHHFGKCSDPNYDVVKHIPKCYYASGPMYFLGNQPIFHLQNLFFNGYFTNCFYEDIMIGSNLQYPVSCFDTYVDEIKHQHRSCIQNVDNKIRNLYVVIHGGLGNQLFQIASAFGLAQKYGRYLVVLTLEDHSRYMHQKKLDEYTSTIFNRFPCITWKEEMTENCQIYSEMDGENNCFEFSSKLDLGLAENRDRDWLMQGYFQNEKYFLEYRDALIGMIWQSGICDGLRVRFSACNLEKSYFLHIRRGDYVDNDLYAMDMDTYYKTAIEKVLEKDSDAHFYVLSNDIEFCRNYGVLRGLNATFLDREWEFDVLNSLFFMSLCSKGGICANSSFSWWGSWLNPNVDKLVIMPKQWIQRDDVMDIYPRGAILI